MKIKTVLTEMNFNSLSRLFRTEQDYRDIMQALYSTREGLAMVLENNPHIEHKIQPQIYAVNHLIGCLDCHELPHPIHALPAQITIPLDDKLVSDF